MMPLSSTLPSPISKEVGTGTPYAAVLIAAPSADMHGWVNWGGKILFLDNALNLTYQSGKETLLVSPWHHTTRCTSGDRMIVLLETWHTQIVGVFERLLQKGNTP